MSSLLQLENICKRYPGVQALKSINLQVERGEIHALLGENGAGKSTLMKILGGVEHQDEGRILIDGQARHFATYRDAIAAGIGIVFQEFSLIPDLTAVENIFLGHELNNRFGLLRKRDMHEASQALFQRLGVSIDLQCPVRRLSVAEQQFVEIAKALALEARLLVLDEPTATLTPSEAELLFEIMRELKRQGVAVIFISHHLEEIFQVCDRISVLRDGGNAGVTDVADSDIDRLVEMMVGRKLECSFPAKPTAARGPLLLEVRDIQLQRNGPHNQFQLHQGEILGFAGLVGSGRTELALGMMGALPSVTKDVWLRGAKNQPRRPGPGVGPRHRPVAGKSQERRPDHRFQHSRKHLHQQPAQVPGRQRPDRQGQGVRQRRSVDAATVDQGAERRKPGVQPERRQPAESGDCSLDQPSLRCAGVR